MRSFSSPSALSALATTLLAFACALSMSCSGGGGGGGGNGGNATSFVGVWQYQTGSFSFVNCGFSSTQVPLARSGFQIVDEAGVLVRVNPDGCRFTVVPTTATHAEGRAQEECTVHGADSLGGTSTTVYRLKSLSMELKPDGTQMAEVFFLGAVQTTSAGTVNCEISGSNTLDRAP